MKYAGRVLGIASLIVLASTFTADAQRGRGSDNAEGGICPTGTCANNGGMRAKNLKNCRKENCRRGTQLFSVKPI